MTSWLGSLELTAVSVAVYLVENNLIFEFWRLMYGVLVFREQYYNNGTKEYKLAVVFLFPSSVGEVHSDRWSFSVCLRNSGEGKYPTQAEGIYMPI